MPHLQKNMGNYILSLIQKHVKSFFTKKVVIKKIKENQRVKSIFLRYGIYNKPIG